VVELIFEALIGQKVKSDALIAQKWVKRERESRGIITSIFDILFVLIQLFTIQNY
jgi:hypothetical protein